MSKCMVFACRFHRFATEHGIGAADLAELITLARRAFKAGERNCNEGTPASQKAEQTAGEKFEERAKGMGFGVTWPGLWPTLTLDERDIYLPEM